VHAAGPAAGPGWTGTKYTFTITPSRGPGPAYRGTVYVDSTGLVRQLVTEVVLNVRSATSHRRFQATFIDAMTFGDFRSPVRVTAPPARQVEDLGQGLPAFNRFIAAYVYALDD
jgi:hypothetical protein